MCDYEVVCVMVIMSTLSIPGLQSVHISFSSLQQPMSLDRTSTGSVYLCLITLSDAVGYKVEVIFLIVQHLRRRSVNFFFPTSLLTTTLSGVLDKQSSS